MEARVYSERWILRLVCSQPIFDIGTFTPRRRWGPPGLGKRHNPSAMGDQSHSFPLPSLLVCGGLPEPALSSWPQSTATGASNPFVPSLFSAGWPVHLIQAASLREHAIHRHGGIKPIYSRFIRCRSPVIRSRLPRSGYPQSTAAGGSKPFIPLAFTFRESGGRALNPCLASAASREPLPCSPIEYLGRDLCRSTRHLAARKPQRPGAISSSSNYPAASRILSSGHSTNSPIRSSDTSAASYCALAFASSA